MESFSISPWEAIRHALLPGIAIAASQNRRDDYYYGGAPAYYGGSPAYYGGDPYYGSQPYYGGYGYRQSNVPYFHGHPNAGW